MDFPKSFLVTCIGRSGSQWLARELNRCSTIWTVEHEPQNNKLKTERYYGAVDCLRVNNPEDHVQEGATLGVILRKPSECARSYLKRKPWMWEKGYLQRLICEMRAVHRLALKPGIVIIRFELMTSDPGYLERKAHELDILDFDPSKIRWSKCNSSPSGALAKSMSEQISEAEQWFIERWWNGDELP